jgi:hypothetical protein|tara:strand:+ start:1620 stop:1859 length:240 start_codon:yes stop_codon:yes gene_type:complete
MMSEIKYKEYKHGQYFWGVISAVIIMVIAYLILPLNSRLTASEGKVITHDIRISVIESKIDDGFKMLKEKLEKIEGKLE